jgi:translation initiation factor IF-1
MANDIQRGQVIEVLPDTKYRVELEGGREVICYLAGKMKLNKIRVLIGDRVQVVVDPYGGKVTNRIVRRGW